MPDITNKAISSIITTSEKSGEIHWYVERRGSGSDIVLVPSGEGDCASFELIASGLAKEFRVTTFDTPGFSRSLISGDVEISMPALAGQIASLISVLGIENAIFYGCSSAGLAVLDLVIHHPSLVKHAVVHEAALPVSSQSLPMVHLAALDDAAVAEACVGLFENLMNEDTAAWRALGIEYHNRLYINYPVWVRHYGVGPKHEPIDPSLLKGKRITWTIGGLMEVRMFFSNIQLAHQAGIDLEMLPCKHFPQVSIPDVLIDHIKMAAGKK